MENAIEWINGDSIATITLSKKKLINKIKELEKKFPNDVKILHENKNGSIVAHIPISYIKLNHSERTLSEEERKLLSERMKKINSNKKTQEK